MYVLRDDQEMAVRETSAKLATCRSVIFQLATGGGKTVILSAITHRYNSKSGKKVLILVHREELLKQTLKTIFQWYGVMGYAISAGGGKKVQGWHDIYVGMVDTVWNRLDYLPDIGLVIMDETHIGNFKKIHSKFEHALVIGFSATPISSSKKDPLKNYFEDIICGADIADLIKLNQEDEEKGLVQNITYAIKGAVDRSKLKVNKSGEYDEKVMGDEFSKSYNIDNALKAYQDYSPGKKAIVFNCNVEHSMIVSEYFNMRGVPSRHLDSSNGSPDGTMTNEVWRRDCLKWLRETPGAVLHNVGILTTGFDEPSIEVVMVNKATLSLSHWLQMCGRGSRPYPGKQFFIILDLGGNAVTHGDWCEERNWRELFHNPKKPSGSGVAPVKECPNCEAIIAASAYNCKFCKFEFDQKPMKYDQAKFELVLFTKNIDVESITKRAEENNYKEYYPLFEIARLLVNNLKNNLGELVITEDIYLTLLTTFNEKCKVWYNKRGSPLSKGAKVFTEKILINELNKNKLEWPQL